MVSASLLEQCDRLLEQCDRPWPVLLRKQQVMSLGHRMHALHRELQWGPCQWWQAWRGLQPA